MVNIYSEASRNMIFKSKYTCQSCFVSIHFFLFKGLARGLLKKYNLSYKIIGC